MIFKIYVATFFLHVVSINLSGEIEILIGASREEVLETVEVKSEHFRALEGSIGSSTLLFDEPCEVGYLFDDGKVTRMLCYFQIKDEQFGYYLSAFDRIREWMLSISENYKEFYLLDEIVLGIKNMEGFIRVDESVRNYFNFIGYTGKLRINMKLLYDQNPFEKVDTNDRRNPPFLMLDIKAVR